MKKFVNKHVVVSFTLLIAISGPLLWYLIDFPLKYLGINYQYSLAVKNMATALVCIVFMYCIWGKCIFSLKNRKFFKSLFTYGLVGVIGSIGAFMFNISEINLKPTAVIIIGYLAMNLAIAVSEEFLFRGIMMNTMLKVWKGQKNVVINTVLVSSMLFGIRHFTNLITYPNQIVTTFAQVVFTIMAGIYLAAVYYRSKNIWLVILVHFLEDTAVTIMEAFSTQVAESSVSDISAFQAILMVIIQIPYVWVGLLMLKDKKIVEQKNAIA